ncbi:MAG: 50S ribosomal protein L20 [Deltaproteobacteria bacterium RIFCSPLOWO2_01_44_7]|nr:MAG: 50S ribosomal protein L20 [Deltaproteobacteria bacterium RIFCSPHIGHO2_01_FULL_43_49]OGQ15685.1 MAG: 50S ribosomal protein L20 [Deltaproteobacteria bacterium RIFCSPHIGHO2_02_FULL_44_53]OGQ28654.1 MAG: 50S ribosomal protein L20 [Deltaproteobacteria bacterium RIFCSPHIGHO2_12_FULL_44_21]OGQ31976.1 MAG: 50S ribosomal protein L20 [Deltaproteobacteria bacterium RIFCSPLOWO2_01_FULL_45_74]OGQ42319.1 MAG: 50S ribosomal protein L20 [Deltaproteobacteria bacterium RIFCSPLOWO2_01_44_7]OGQ43591.1 MAG
MARVKRGTKARQRRKKVLKLAEGYYGGRHRLFRTAKEAVDRALVYAYKHRKTRKREFRQLWQIRIGAAVQELGLSYNHFMHALKKKEIGLNRKMLAELAATQPKDFAELVAMTQK